MSSKADLINKLTNSIDDLDKEDVKNAVDFILSLMQEQLALEKRIEIRGLGSFSIRKRRRPGALEEYNIVYYRMSKMIEKRLNVTLDNSL